MSVTKSVEILFFAGCPNYEQTRDVVEHVAAEENVPIELRLVQLASPEEAEQHRFLGSPTVRVEDRDIEPGANERETFTFACRLYRTDSGLSGQPDERWLRAALRL